MIGVTVDIEIGPNIVASVALICSAVTVYLQQKTRKELKPNAGASMRDAVDRIERHTGQLAAVNPAIAETPADHTAAKRVEDAWHKATGGEQ